MTERGGEPEGAARWVRGALCLGAGLLVLALPRPAEVPPEGWRMLAIFVAVIAGFLLRPFPMGPVVVFGVVEDRIDGSLRTNSASVDPALFMESAFGVDSNGRPYGGGRADKGGFQIPLGVLADCEDGGVLLKLARQAVRKRLTRVVPGLNGGDQ